MASIIIRLFPLLLLVIVNANRIKRQLSPAVRLENDLQPIVRLIGIEQYKRDVRDAEDEPNSMADDSRRHLSPSLEVDDRLGKLMALQSVGKRQLSPGRQFDLHPTYHRIMAQLADAGRKRSISPAVDLQSQIAALSRMVDQAGRR